MSKKRASDNISLTAFDDLFGAPSEGEQIVEVALKELHEFQNHPFRVLDDEKMYETVASVKEQGIIVPGIVRPRKEGGYEIIAGHRRKRAAELAFDQLVEIGVIKRFFYNIEYSNGRTIPNQMFIDLNILVLKEISYPKEEGGTTSKQVSRKLVPSNCNESAENADEMGVLNDAEKTDGISGQNEEDILTNLSGYPAENVPISQPEISVYGDSNEMESCNYEDGYPSGNFRTNTNNTTNNIYKDHIISITQETPVQRQRREEIDAIRQKTEFWDQLIKRHINYDWHMENDDVTRREDYHELYLIMHDVMCGEHSGPMIVNKTPMDPEEVKRRYLQLNDSHLEYVIDRLHDNPNQDGIRDIRSYMITCLYNAPATIGQYYQQWVNHDNTNGVFLKNRKENEGYED